MQHTLGAYIVELPSNMQRTYPAIGFREQPASFEGKPSQYPQNSMRENAAWQYPGRHLSCAVSG